MSDQINILEETPEESQAFLSKVQRVLMAGFGAASLAQEEAESFINKLVSRGEIAEKDGRNLITEFANKRRERVEASNQWVEEELEKRMAILLSRMNIPTKTDIAHLTQKVSELAQRVEALKESQS